MRKHDLVLNNQEGLICRKTQSTNHTHRIQMVEFCQLMQKESIQEEFTLLS